MQKYFTFRENDKNKIISEFYKFLANHFSYTFIDFLLSILFLDILFIDVFYGKLIILVIMTPLSFALQKYWVFK